MGVMGESVLSRSVWSRIVAIVVCALMVFVAAPSVLAVSPSASNASSGSTVLPAGSAEFMNYIHVNDLSFDPLGKMPDVPDSLLYSSFPSVELVYYIVQLKGPVTEDMKTALAGTGVTVLNYLSYSAFIVKADSVSLAKAQNLWCTRWVGVFEPAYKISPRLASSYDKVLETMQTNSEKASAASTVFVMGEVSAKAPHQSASADSSYFAEKSNPRTTATSSSRASPTVGSNPSTIAVEIQTFEKSRVIDVAHALSQLGAKNVVYSLSGEGKLRATIERGVIQQLALEIGVMFIDRYVQPAVYNDIARWVVQSNDDVTYATPVHDNGIWGTNQTVTLGDSGLDYGHPAFSDPSNNTPGPDHRKVTDYYIPSDAYGSYTDEDINHGTHTSGTVAGDDGTWHVYDGDPFGSSGSSGPHDGQAFDAKVQMQDLSPDGYYVYPPTYINDMYYEASIRGSYIHSNSWGSAGAAYIQEAADTDQFIWDNQEFLVLYAAANPGSSPGWINPYATAKNVIGVGASLNGAYREDMADFSGRGPASDGRIKPDVTAPGVNTWSAEGADPYGDGTSYFQLSGTSMATPCVAGSAALVRQYFMDGYYPTGSAVPSNGFIPTAALIKAVLINGAVEMTGNGAYTNGETFYPNNNQGWGRLDMDNALFFPGDSRGLVAIDDRFGLTTGASQVYNLTIGSASQPVEITLVWSDYPGVAMSDPNLVNDLDLIVIAPDGTYYLGNKYIGYNPGESEPNPADYDRLNNVESVLVISAAQPGIWTIVVEGYNVPEGPQPFALVMTGAIATDRGSVQMDSNSYQSSAMVGITVVDTGLNLDPGAIDYAIAEMSSSTENVPELVTLTETAESSSVFVGWIQLELSASPVNGDGLLQVQDGDLIIAAYYDDDDGSGGSGYVYDYAVVDDTPPVIWNVQITNVRYSRATVEWNTDEPADSVVFWGSSTPPSNMEYSASFVYNHSMILRGLAENTTYYVAVMSSDEAGNTAYDDNSGTYYEFTTPPRPPIAPPNEDWPTFHNNEPRQGVSPSLFQPPVDMIWSSGANLESRWSGPVVSDGLLYTSTLDGVVRARDLYSGAVVWSRALGESYYYTCSPTVANGIVYVSITTSSSYSVYALDGMTGETIWSDSSYMYSARSAMAYADGSVFIGTWNNEMVALDAMTGSVEWAYNTGTAPILGGATVTGGVLYTALIDLYSGASSFLALDEASGALLWSLALDDTAIGPPLYAQGNVYIGTYSGTMYALDAATGSVAWTFYGGTVIDFGTPAYDGMAIFYVDVYGGVYALDAGDGSLLWSTSVGGGSACAPAYANGYLYFSSWDGNLYSVDTFDGSVVDSDFIGPASTSSPAVYDGWIYVEANDGSIVGFLGQVPVGLLVIPMKQAMDAVPDSQVDYIITVTNVGTLGIDTFDVTVMLGGLGWATDLYAWDGVTPLPDTDGDTLPDTGPLGTWESATIIARVTVPAGAMAGDSDQAIITFTSSTDPAVSKTASVATTVPPPGVSIGPSVYVPSSPGDIVLSFLTVENTGGFPDTMDITYSTMAGWNTMLVESDGVTPLSDHDSDGVPDTGELPGLASTTIGVIVEVPPGALEGAVERATVWATSSLDTNMTDSATVILELAPPPNDEWPTYHNNDARTGVSPSRFSPPLEVMWAQHGTGSGSELVGPVMADGILFTTSEDGYIKARDAYTGDPIWERMLGDVYYYTGTPAVDGGVVFATFYGSSGGYVYALDEITGDTIWSVGPSSGIDFNARVAMAAKDGLVYGAAWTGQVFALDESDGSIVWSYSTGDIPYGGVAIGGGYAFIASLNGNMYAFEKDTGALAWTTFLDPAEFTAPPLYAQGCLFVGNTMGSMFAVDSASGTVLWQTMLNAPIEFSTPAYSGTAIFIGTLGAMFYALDPVDGSIIWSTPVNDWVLCSPAYANGYVYTTVWNGDFVTFDAATGAIVDSQYLGFYVFTTSPAVSDGWVWINDYGSSIYGLMGQMPYGVRLIPVMQSQDVYPPMMADFSIQATNIGTFGPDTFDVTLSLGALGWTAELFEADGVTPLGDTDGDSVPDTGSLDTGYSTTIVVRVTVPDTGTWGDVDSTGVIFTSSNDPTVSKEASVICEVPPPDVEIGPNSYLAVLQNTIALADMNVTNAGGLEDTVDVTAYSPHAWTISLFQSDGVTPLVDTDGDMIPDTGPLAGGASLPIVVAVEVPSDALNGTLDKVAVVASSDADPSETDEARLLLEVSPEFALDWPQFQHDAAKSGISGFDAVLPMTEKWSVNPYYWWPSWFSPVIHAGTVFYTSENGYVLALDLKTGAEKWEVQLGMGGYTPSGPIAAYGNVYVAFVSDYTYVPTLYCLDETTGAVLWSSDGFYYAPYLWTCSIVAAQGMVFWNDGWGYTLYANDAFTGELLWTYSLSGELNEGPTYWGGMIFAADSGGNSSGEVVAIDAFTGSLVWSTYIAGSVYAPISVSDGVLYFGDYGGNVYAMDATTGAVIWTTPLNWWIDLAAPVVADGMVFVGVGSYPDGMMCALDVSTGGIVWEAYTYGGPIYSSPAYSNGMVFCTADNGHLYAWDAATGEQLQDMVVENYAVMSSAALANGYIVVCDGMGQITAYGFEGVGVVDHISLTPTSADVAVMHSVVLEAHAYDIYGNEITTDADLTWSSLNGLGSVVAVSDDGSRAIYFAGPETGNDVVQVSAMGIDASATVEILPGSAEGVYLTPSSASVAVDGSVQFTALVTDAFGNEIPDAVVAWNVVGVDGSIDADGLFTAGTVAGEGTIEASYDDLIGVALITVLPGELDSISVTPGGISMQVGAIEVLKAQGFDAYGNAIAGLVYDWSTTVGSISPVADTSQAVLIAGIVAGDGIVTVTSGTALFEVDVSVLPGPLAALSVTPSSFEVSVGGSSSFSVQATDMFGNVLSGLSIDWTVEGDIGSIDSSGAFTAGTVAGSGLLVASSGGIRSEAAVTVTPGPVDRIEVLPDTLTMSVGGIATLWASGYDAYDNPLSGLIFSWSTTRGSVSPAGDTSQAVFQAGMVAGSGTLTVSSGTKSATVPVAVSAGGVARITISPATASVAIGGTQQFSVNCYDLYGNALTGVTIAYSVSGGMGTVSSSGLFTAGDFTGTASVTATAGGLSAVAAVEIGPGSLDSFSVAPVPSSMMVGDVVTVAVMAFDSADNEIEDFAFTWEANSLLSVSQISGTNMLLVQAGVVAGAGSLTVTVPGVTGSSSATFPITVSPGPLSVLVIEPAAIVMNDGDSVELSVAGYDAYGNAISGLTYTWSVSVPTDGGAEGTVNAGADTSGATFTAEKAGDCSVVVTVGTKTASVHVTVDSQPSTLTDAGPTIAIVALVLAIIAIILLAMMMLRKKPAT